MSSLNIQEDTLRKAIDTAVLVLGCDAPEVYSENTLTDLRSRFTRDQSDQYNQMILRSIRDQAVEVAKNATYDFSIDNTKEFTERLKSDPRFRGYIPND